MAFQSTALIDSSIPRGEIKKIDRPLGVLVSFFTATICQIKNTIKI